MNLYEQAIIAEAVLRLIDAVDGNQGAVKLLYSVALTVFRASEEQRLRKLHPNDPEESLVDKYFGTGETMGSPTDGGIDWPLLMEILEYTEEGTPASKAYIARISQREMLPG